MSKFKNERYFSEAANAAARRQSPDFIKSERARATIRRNGTNLLREIRAEVSPGDTVLLEPRQNVQVRTISSKTNMVYFVGGEKMSVVQFSGRFREVTQRAPEDWRPSDRYDFDKYNPDYGRRKRVKK